jgi:hypothetical protein
MYKYGTPADDQLRSSSHGLAPTVPVDPVDICRDESLPGILSSHSGEYGGFAIPLGRACGKAAGSIVRDL